MTQLSLFDSAPKRRAKSPYPRGAHVVSEFSVKPWQGNSGEWRQKDWLVFGEELPAIFKAPKRPHISRLGWRMDIMVLIIVAWEVDREKHCRASACSNRYILPALGIEINGPDWGQVWRYLRERIHAFAEEKTGESYPLPSDCTFIQQALYGETAPYRRDWPH